MGETVSTMDDAALTADGLGFVDPDGVPKTELLVESNPTTSAAAAAAAAAAACCCCWEARVLPPN